MFTKCDQFIFLVYILDTGFLYTFKLILILLSLKNYITTIVNEENMQFIIKASIYLWGKNSFLSCFKDLPPSEVSKGGKIKCDPEKLKY